MNKLLWSAAGVAAIVAVTAGLWASRDRLATPIAQVSSPAGKQKLALLTSLPILFGERFGLDSGGSPLLSALGQDYDVQSIAITDAGSLKPFRLLFMAHARAQPAEALVDLDQWVRSGGRLLILADPRLDWHSERPLGDPLRPPPDFADTGLLGHWGLSLSGPTVEGPAVADIDGGQVVTIAPGKLATRGRQCEIAGGGLIARCTIGRGGVTVIADADFLNVGGPDAIDGPVDHNLALVDRELARLAR